MVLLRHAKVVKNYMANTLVGPIRDQAVEVQSKQLLNLIKRSKLSLDECTEVTVELQSMGDTFPASTVQELVLAVGLRAGGTSSELGVQDKMQDFGNRCLPVGCIDRDICVPVTQAKCGMPTQAP